MKATVRLDAVAGMARRLLGFQRPAPSEPAAEAVPPLSDAPLDVLAAKLLFSHLRNRQQLLGPPPTTLGHLDQHQAELLIHAAVVAATADGQLDEGEERRLRAALATLESQAGEPNFVSAALKKPRPLETVLRDVRDPHLASLVYAASLLTIDKHREVNRAYLAYLALRLRLPEGVLTRLHSQYGVPAAPPAS